MVWDQCRALDLMSSICLRTLSGTKALPSVHSLNFPRSLSFNLLAKLGSNISTSGASISSSMRPFYSEWSRQERSCLSEAGAGRESAILEMGVQVFYLARKMSLIIPKRQIMPRKINILLILLVKAQLLRQKIDYFLALLVRRVCLSCQFQIFCKLHSCCSFLFISSSSLTLSFFLSLEIWADILFLCFFVSSSSSSVMVMTGQVFLMWLGFLRFLALLLLIMLFCFRIFRFKRSRSTFLKARFTYTKRRISPRGVSQISMLFQRQNIT